MRHTKRDGNAVGVGEQLVRTFPPDGTPAFSTRPSNNMHSTTSCPRYLHALRQNEARFPGSVPRSPVWRTAGHWREQGKGVCGGCWENGRPIG